MLCTKMIYVLAKHCLSHLCAMVRASKVVSPGADGEQETSQDADSLEPAAKVQTCLLSCSATCHSCSAAVLCLVSTAHT